jgi:NTE family protein
MGVSLESGRAWDRRDAYKSGVHRQGMSLYLGADTAIGPIYAALLHSPRIGPTVMLFVGRP